jgi:predicted enzyme related to lactoylglutathione lyase
MTIKNNHINYIEFKATNLKAIKAFYSICFNWEFTDYGPDYISFSESGIEGGFEYSETEIKNGALIVLYNNNLEVIQNKIIECKGSISKDLFSFPGGKRFHFKDPSGNELAVWCHV